MNSRAKRIVIWLLSLFSMCGILLFLVFKYFFEDISELLGTTPAQELKGSLMNGVLARTLLILIVAAVGIALIDFVLRRSMKKL